MLKCVTSGDLLKCVTSGDLLKCVTSGEVQLRGLVSEQHSSVKTSQRWRSSLGVADHLLTSLRWDESC